MKTMKPLKAIIVEDNVFMATVLQDLLTPHNSDISLLDVVHNG